MSARVLGEYLSWHMPNRRYYYISLDDAWGRSMEQALREATRAATVPVTAIRRSPSVAHAVVNTWRHCRRLPPATPTYW